jgi:hypothetical protein
VLDSSKFSTSSWPYLPTVPLTVFDLLNSPLVNYVMLKSVVMFLITGVSSETPLPQQKMGKTTRVVVCGLKGVGKTAILEQLIYGNVTKTTVWIKPVFLHVF